MTIDHQDVRMKVVLRKTTLYVIALSCGSSVFCRDFSSGERLTLRLGVNCDVTGGGDSEVWNRRRYTFPIFVVDRRVGTPSSSLTTTERRFSRALLHLILLNQAYSIDFFVMKLANPP